MTTQTMHGAGTNSLADLMQTLGRAVAAIRTGVHASRDWQRMSAMSDQALAREGLTRDQIARVVFDRNFR